MEAYVGGVIPNIYDIRIAVRRARHPGEAIRIAREERHMQQQYLAVLLHIDASTLSRYECGREVPEEILVEIARILGCPELLEIRCRMCAVGRCGERRAA